MLSVTHINEQEFGQLRNVSRSLTLLLLLLENLAGSSRGASVAAADMVATLLVHLPTLQGVIEALQARNDKCEQEVSAHGGLMGADDWKALFIGLMAGKLDARTYQDITDRLMVEAHCDSQLTKALNEWLLHWSAVSNGEFVETVPTTSFVLPEKVDPLEIGARLLLIRNSVRHGRWVKHVEELGIDQRRASRLMQAALLYRATEKPRSEKMLNLGISKLTELMPLGEDLITELDAGGNVHGLTLDAIDGMTTKELRKALGKALKAERPSELSQEQKLQLVRLEGRIKASTTRNAN